MWYLHIHFVWDRLFAWFAMVAAFPGRCVLSKRILLRSAAAPKARAEPSTRTRIAGGFSWPRCARPQAHEPANTKKTPRFVYTNLGVYLVKQFDYLHESMLRK